MTHRPYSFAAASPVSLASSGPLALPGPSARAGHCTLGRMAAIPTADPLRCSRHSPLRPPQASLFAARPAARPPLALSPKTLLLGVRSASRPLQKTPPPQRCATAHRPFLFPQDCSFSRRPNHPSAYSPAQNFEPHPRNATGSRRGVYCHHGNRSNASSRRVPPSDRRL